MAAAVTRRALTDDLFRPRKLRVIAGIQRCIRCDKPYLHGDLQAGWAFHTCGRNAHASRPRFRARCDACWWSLALPPEAPAGYMCAIMGEDLAKIVLARGFPESAAFDEPELWGYILNPGNEQAWLQIAVRPRERHLYRRSKLSHLITSFLL